jgi:amidase
MFVADGGKSLRKILDTEKGKEPFRPEMMQYEKAKDAGVYDMWQMQLQKLEINKAYMDRWNASDGMDAILCKFY